MKKFRIVFLTIITLFGAATVSSQTRVSITWEVLRYELTATLPQNFSADRTMDVAASLRLKNASDRSFSRLTLRISDQAEFSSVSIDGSAADFSKGEESIGGSRKLQRAVVSLPATAPGASFTVRVNYKLRVNSNSGLNSLSPVNSQFLPLSFWYPTPNSWFFTGGADFAPFNLKVNNAAGLTIVSSGTETENAFDQKSNGQPFFTTGRWDIINTNGITVYAPKGIDAGGNKIAGELSGFLAAARDFVTDLSGKTNLPVMRIVAVNRGAGFSDGGTVFIDDSVFRRRKIDALTAMILAESAAKLWLGNIVEVNGDGYGVIREGLSRYIATQIIEKQFGKEIADIERLRQRTDYSAIASRDAPLNVVSPVDGYYYTATANKGAIIWSYLVSKFGDRFFDVIRQNAVDGELNLDELRGAFSAEKEYIDYTLDQSTAMNLMAGIPQHSGNQSRVALRNLGEVAATVKVAGTTAAGQKIFSTVTVPANGFSEVVFRSPDKIVSAEIDPDKAYPQTNYADDIAPREIDENDPLLFIKRDFDRQRFADAENKARIVLKSFPAFDDAQILLARSLLSQGKITEAGQVFQSTLDGKLPAATSIGWANVGLGDIAQKLGQSANALSYYKAAIDADAEYGASLTARLGRNKLNAGGQVDDAIRNYFNEFDAAVNANSKSMIDSLVVAGEVSRFASSVAGQAQQWRTKIVYVDPVDPDNVLVETDLNLRLLNREDESGMAVFRLSRVGGRLKLSGVEIFEVR